jgi:predicted AlkP superfamily pyrophosphatase or phosphodiesterase
MRGAKYLPAKSIDDRIDQAIQLLATTRDDALVYLYIPELDQIAHASGSESSRWLAALEDVDAAVRRLVAALGKFDAVLLTADHGIVDVPKHGHVYLDEVELNWNSVASVGGDPRVNYLYLNEPEQTREFVNVLQSALGDSVAVFDRPTALGANLFGQRVSNTALERLPEVFVLAVKKVAIYHRDYAPTKSLEMVGQHGALSSQEMAIPLLGWGAFNSI